MTSPALQEEPGRVDEPRAAQDYADVLSQVAAAGRPVIVRRNGQDLAAVIPVEYLRQVREILTQNEVENLAAQLDWSQGRSGLAPPQHWLDDENDNPFEPEQELVV
jgi:PHD/YefM family antitoxin component YafN of YafNO toxin-antitoxin module